MKYELSAGNGIVSGSSWGARRLDIDLLLDDEFIGLSANTSVITARPMRFYESSVRITRLFLVVCYLRKTIPLSF